MFEKVAGLFKTKKAVGSKSGEYNEDLADYVNNEYKRRQIERLPWELQWKINMEFLNGNQYLTIDTIRLSIEEVPLLTWYEQREVFNQIATIFETRVARLTRQRPMLKNRPASGDDKDISASKVTTSLLTSTWFDQEMTELHTEFVQWMEACGTAFYETPWDPRKGRLIYKTEAPDDQEHAPLENDVNLNPETEEAFGKGKKIIEIREGDIATNVKSPFSIYPDSCFRNGLNDCRSIIDAQAMHIHEIEEIYGVQVEAEQVDVTSMQTSRTGSGTAGIGILSGGYRGGTTSLKDHAVLKKYYEKPSAKYPEGRHIIVAGSKTLYYGTMPYLIGKDGEPDFPFEMAVAVKATGQFFGKSIIERCIPIQRRYNALRNRKAEYLNMVAIGQWYKPKGTIDDDEELNNAPNNIIEYDANIANGAKPEPVQFPNLPNSFENEERSLLAEFTSVSGVSELSRMSEAPSGVKSGVALGIASDQDDTRLATTSQRIASAIVGVGIKWIRLYRQFAKEPRILRTVGSNREADVRDWSASDLRSDDVIIENASALSESPSQRRQMVFDLIASGLFTRPELSTFTEDAKRKIFELLEYGHWESGMEDDHFLQVSRAKRENKNILQGLPQQVMDFDDHQLHILEHNRERMQADYDELLKQPFGPIIDHMMRMHIAEHIQIMLAMIPPEPQLTDGQEQPQRQGKSPNTPVDKEKKTVDLLE